MPRGGKRSGAGRPRQDADGMPRRKHSIYCTDEELEAVRGFLAETRTVYARRKKPKTTAHKEDLFSLIEYKDKPQKK